MITEHHSEKKDHVSTTPKKIDAQEECYNDSGNSLNANAIDQPWTLSDLLMKEERLDTIEVKEDGISTSVILDIETVQDETEALGLEENSSNTPNILDCSCVRAVQCLHLHEHTNNHGRLVFEQLQALHCHEQYDN